MIDYAYYTVDEMQELSSQELEQAQGGDVVPTNQVSLNYSKVEVQSAQSAAGYDSEYKYVSIRRY